MDTSTYFNLNLVTGSDKVNPLTVDRPNYEKIDDQMHKNQINSVVEASELKSGTVHAITCLTENAVFFRFTATSDFTAGDTFTFNGTTVSAVLPDGSGLQTGAFKINGTVLCSIIGTLLTVYSYTTSGIASDSDKLGGQLPAYYAKSTDAVTEFIHSRIGGVNNFVGVGSNGKVKFSSNIQSGDTVQVNGTAVTAYCGMDDFVQKIAGANIVGKTFYFAYDESAKVITFAIPTDSGRKLLWENESPSASSFAAQDVFLDLSKFNHIAVLCSYTTGTVSNNNAYVIVPVDGVTISATMVSGNQFNGRGITATASKVTFGGGTDTTKVIPQKIYGINL